MPKMTTDFTESYVRGLPIPEGKDDDSYSHRGLRLRVYPSGAKKWSYFKHAPNSVRKTIPIGEYPSVSVKQARDIADKRLGDMIREGHEIESNKAGVTFGNYMLSDEYKNWSISTRRSHKTIMANLQAVVPLWFTRKPLKLFANNDFTKFCNDRKTGKDGLTDKGVEESTINRSLNNIRSVFKHAYNNRVIKENPMDRFSNLQEPEKPEIFNFTDDERRRLIAVACDRTLPQADKRRHMEAYVLLGLETGLRNGELMSLKWKHFKNKDMEVREMTMGKFKYLSQYEAKKLYSTKESRKAIEEFVTMAEQGKYEGMSVEEIQDMALRTFEDIKGFKWHIEVDGTHTKSGKKRVVPVSSGVVRVVRDYIKWKYLGDILAEYPDMKALDDNLNVIFIDKPTALNALDEAPIIPVGKVDKAFSTIHKHAGLPKGTFIHTMRHDFCTEMIKKGVNIATVQALAGHADIRTTTRYLHALRGTDFSELDELNLSERITNQQS